MKRDTSHRQLTFVGMAMMFFITTYEKAIETRSSDVAVEWRLVVAPLIFCR
jgi:hypothetical protein